MRQMAPPSQAGAQMSAPTQPQPMNAVPSPLEFRIHEMNRRLYIFNSSGICEKDFAQWWDAFSHEFFDDDAKIWINIVDEHSPHSEKYVLGRQLIPRFFRSFFESKIREMYFVIRGQSRESQAPSGMIHYENQDMLQVTKHDVPNAEVQTKFKLFIEFTPYDEILNHRIRTWSMELESCQEFFMNEITKEYEIHHPDGIDKSPLTRVGMPLQTMACLSMSRILEPMQMLMSQSKTSGLSPRDAMTRTLFAHHTKMQQQQQMAMQHMNQPSMLPPTTVEEQKPKPARKRQRKTTTNSKSKKANASPAPANAGFPSNPMPGNFSSMGFQDVMVVGEPSMMGGDYGEEDERTISRVENAQYDPNALQLQMQSLGPSGHIGGPGMSNMQSGPSMGPPSGSQMSGAGAQLVPGGPQMVQAGAIGPGSVPMGPGIPSSGNQQLTQLGQPQNGHPPPQGLYFACTSNYRKQFEQFV
ncbi:LIM-domain binding protein [Oesophagostomum dentatum]|uniref:LIM-domain binding protein n=1 Tax=Oesophagostomum dentatum TaxID=61180 RepID=A0A0B1TG84_OESDE|nr:LIM-domain binding protein [Oesophagostomum dentatum]